MKNIKKVFIIFCLIMFFFLQSCFIDLYESNYKRFRRYPIEYLDEAELLFFDYRISGFDSSGVYYAVYKFEERPEKFLDQFYDHKDMKNSTCGNGPNEIFERNTMTLINTFYKERYENLNEEYKINWDEDYFYAHYSPEYVTYPIIYLEDSYKAILIRTVD